MVFYGPGGVFSAWPLSFPGLVACSWRGVACGLIVSCIAAIIG